MKAAGVVIISVVGLVTASFTPMWAPECSRACLTKAIDLAACRTTDTRCLCQEFVIEKIVKDARPCLLDRCNPGERGKVVKRLRFGFCWWPRVGERPGRRPPPANDKQPPKGPKRRPMTGKFRSREFVTRSRPTATTTTTTTTTTTSTTMGTTTAMATTTTPTPTPAPKSAVKDDDVDAKATAGAEVDGMTMDALELNSITMLPPS